MIILVLILLKWIKLLEERMNYINTSLAVSSQLNIGKPCHCKNQSVKHLFHLPFLGLIHTKQQQRDASCLTPFTIVQLPPPIMQLTFCWLCFGVY